MLPFLIALQFLSSVAVRLPGMPAPEATGRSLLYYPLVGVLFGAVLLIAQLLLSDAEPLLQAAIVLALWVGLSGGLHLDGLADTADAWVGGFGDRERTLSIMKDPRSGPIAIVVLVAVLLLKFAAVYTLIIHGHALALLLAPWLGRSALLGLFLSTPYVRKGGLGQVLAEHMPRDKVRAVLIGTAVAVVLTSGLAGALALALTVAGLWWTRRLMTGRLGGTTGDTAGAMVELTEALVVTGLALLL